jgi:hypothetical protein
MPPTPSNSQVYRQSLVDAREAWAQKSGLTQAQVKGAYQQAATSVGSRIASAPPTAPSTVWNLSQLQTVINDYASTLDQRVLDAMHAGIHASYHDAADSVLKSAASQAYGSVFGGEAIDAHVRGINQRAAAAFITRTGPGGIKLSDRVWKANQQWRGAVQTVVQSGVIAGQPPVQVARQIEQYLQPGVNVPYKAETAKRLKVPKDTSMPAMRVARTEMQNSFHEGTIVSHGSMPSYLGIRWHIAPGPGHIPDVCDEYAQQGFFPKGTEPLKPHPHCFCTALPVHRDADEVLNDLDEWLANPSSHPDLNDYYKNELLPLLDVEIASVSGGAGGNLLGGYAKGEKVLIDVKGTQVIATVNGEHASKGVLTLIIDPGQGMQSIKVWRAPSKVTLYTGPPTQAIPLQTGPPPPASVTGIDVGDTILANVGAHIGKVGTVQSVNLMGGTYHVQWTDGSENNIVFQNVVKAPPPATGLVQGGQVKLKLMHEAPQLEGQIGQITKIAPDGTVTVMVGVSGQASVFDLKPAATFKLEPLAGLTPGAPPPPIVGYVDDPTSGGHGKPIIKQLDAHTIQFSDGTYGYSGQPWKVSPTDPLAAAAPPPHAPQAVVPPTVTWVKGDKVQFDDPTSIYHGQQAVIDVAASFGVVVKHPDATTTFLNTAEANTILKPLSTAPVTTSARVPATLDDLTSYDPVVLKDPTHADYGKTFYLGDETPAWYSNTQEIALYASKADALTDTDAIYIAKQKLGLEPGFLKHTETPLHQLTGGAEVTLKKSTQGWKPGDKFVLQDDLAGKPADALVGILAEDGSLVDVYVDELTLPSKAPAATFQSHKPIEDYKSGEYLEMNLPGSMYHGQLVKLMQDYSPSSFMQVETLDGNLKTVVNTELTLPPAAFAPQVANAWDHLKAGAKVTVNMPGSAHHGEDVTLYDDLTGKAADDIITVTLSDGTLWSYAVKHVAQTPGTAPQPGAGVAPLQGTTAQVNVPNDSMHGEQVLILESKPGASPSTPLKVEYTTGPNAGQQDFWPLSALVTPGTPITPSPASQPVVLHTPPGAQAIDVTQKGTKVVTDYQGQQVTGTVTSWNAGKNVVTIKPDIPIVGAKKATFTKAPKYVKPIVDPNAPQTLVPPVTTPPVQTTQTPAPPPGVGHLNFGDTAVINMPGSTLHGESVIVSESLAGKSPGYDTMVTLATGPSAGQTKYVFVQDLVAPGTPISTVAPAAHTFVQGDTVVLSSGEHAQVVGTTADTVLVQKPGQTGTTLIYGTDVATLVKAPPAPPPPAVAPPPPTPPPPPAAPTQKVTDKGALVTTEYQGIFVQALVKSFNASKNVVKLTPLVDTPGVPKTFEKSPGKLNLVTPPGVTAAPPVLTPTTAPPPGQAPPPSMPTSLPPDPPKPVMSTMTVKNQAVGGGHVKSIYGDQQGETWMFKPDATAAYAEKAGYNVQGLLGLAIPEMHVMTHGGQVGSMQRFHAGIQGEVKFNTIPSLTDKQRAQIQEHQVVDWLISQHDSNQGAMLIAANGDILAVDKGQAFKFMGQPTEKLHWTYAPNPDSVVYKPLFEGYIAGRYDLDRKAIDGLIARIEALDDNVFKQALKPYAEHAAQRGWVASEDAFYDRAIKRKHNIRADFKKLYDEADTKAGKPLVTTPTVAPPPKPAPAPTVTTNQVTPIAKPLVDDIIRTGHAGRSFMVAGEDIESGNVLAYTLVKPDGSRKLVMEMRVRAHAEPKLLAKLDGVSQVAVASGTPSDPFWNQMLTVVKHVGYHLKPTSTGKDGKLDPTKMAAIQSLAQQINSGSMDPGKAQHYSNVLSTLTGLSSADIATVSMQQLTDQTIHWWATSTAVYNAHFDQYVAPTPSTTTVAPPNKVKAKSETPWAYQRTLKDGELQTTNQRATGRTAGHEGVAQHTLDLGGDFVGTYMPFNQGGNMFSKQGRLTIVKDNYQGTEAEVQAALDQVGRLGIDNALATPEDIELLYLRHQAHAAKVEEASDYKTKVENKITASMTVAEKIAIHKAYWNAKLGVADVAALPAYQPHARSDATYRPVGTSGHQKTEGGWVHFNRFDMTDAQIKQALPRWGLSQSARSGAEGLTRTILDGNGMMSPTEERIRTGVYSSGQGMSSTTDMGTGGAQYVFTRISAPTHFKSRGQFVFDTRLLLRTDIVSYDGDRYGRVDKTNKRDRRVDVNGWKTAEHSGSNEVIIKNSFPFLEYINQIICSTAAERTRTIKLFKDRGIADVRGIKVEDLVTVG